MTTDVEQIVREVVAELQRQGSAVAGACDTAPAPTPAAKATTPKDDPRELAVCSRVVSLAEIGDRLSSIRRLVVPPGAILTPAVRDALDDRNITVVFGPTDRPTAATAAKLLLIAARTTYEPNGLVGALTTRGIGVESHASECLIRTADTLAERVRDGATLGVVLTPDVAAALCLTNRHSGVRAVSAVDSTAAVESARAVGANVLVVDPRGKGLFQLKQIVDAFCRSGPWPCPEVLQPRLG